MPSTRRGSLPTSRRLRRYGRSEPSSPPLSPAQGSEWFSTQYLQSFWINQDLLALVRVAAVPAVHDKGQSRWTRHQAQSRAPPAVHIACRLGKGLVEMRGQGMFRSVTTARRSIPTSDRKRAVGETEEQSVCPWVGHDHTSDDHNRQRQTDPEAGNFVPVVIACAPAARRRGTVPTRSAVLFQRCGSHRKAPETS